MNKQVIFHSLGGTEVLKIENTDLPTPAPNEVIVNVKACGLNRAEYLFFRGQYLWQPVFPSKLGMEAAGVIHSVGRNILKYKKGDKVCLLPNVDITQYGYLGKYVSVPGKHIIQMPEIMGYEEAAAFWIAYGTAYGVLVQKGGLKRNANQTVVITAASSSVGAACIQLAKHFGAKVIATTRTSVKKEFLQNIGADEVITTQEEDLQKRILEITNGRGFDICVEPITGTIINHLAEVAAQEACIVIYGVLNPEPSPLPVYPLLTKGITISGFHLGFHLLDNEHRKKEMAYFLNQELNQGNFKIMIDKVFNLENIKAAYDFMASNQQKGKIVVKVN